MGRMTINAKLFDGSDGSGYGSGDGSGSGSGYGSGYGVEIING